MNPKEISIQDYTYLLPEEKIAKYPLAERDASKLLVYKHGKIQTSAYRHIANYIPGNALLVFNNTKVVEARLLFQKETGGVIEIFCLEPHAIPSRQKEENDPVHGALLQKGKVWWRCLVGGASKWKPGQVLKKNIITATGEITLSATYIEKVSGSFIIELSWQPEWLSFAEVLHFAGAIPLPPYIKRNAEESDKERYQTIYAATEGSVAAPTAGLHFTPAIFKELADKHIQHAFVTLHVGAGTFKPVKSATMLEHEMHAEWIDVTKSLIETLQQQAGNPVIAVGTTSLRTLESLYWMGVKCLEQGADNGDALQLDQWEPYELADSKTSVKASLAALLDWMNKHNTDRLVTKTQILIAPGYSFKIVNGLITNFHQPQSTLLLLVAALTGNDWRKLYEYALQNNFRFLSYGDGSLLWRNDG